MKIEILKMEENDDGSLSVELDLDESAHERLLQAGFNAIMREALETYDNDKTKFDLPGFPY